MKQFFLLITLLSISSLSLSQGYFNYKAIEREAPLPKNTVFIETTILENGQATNYISEKLFSDNKGRKEMELTLNQDGAIIDKAFYYYPDKYTVIEVYYDYYEEDDETEIDSIIYVYNKKDLLESETWIWDYGEDEDEEEDIDITMYFYDAKNRLILETDIYEFGSYPTKIVYNDKGDIWYTLAYKHKDLPDSTHYEFVNSTTLFIKKYNHKEQLLQRSEITLNADQQITKIIHEYNDYGVISDHFSNKKITRISYHKEAIPKEKTIANYAKNELKFTLEFKYDKAGVPLVFQRKNEYNEVTTRTEVRQVPRKEYEKEH